MNILATRLICHVANWRCGKIHVANYQCKTFRYMVDYPHGKIAMWVITKSRNHHVAKNQVFCSDNFFPTPIENPCDW
jgi:hypothetical protein